MTCVLPYRNCNQRRFRTHNLAMPCVFDGCEPLDFESALLSGDWPAPMKDNTHGPATCENNAQRATSDSTERTALKRKYDEDQTAENGLVESKKPCLENSDVVLTSEFSDPHSCESASPVSSTSDDEDPLHNNSTHHHEVASQTSIDEDDEMYLPRRRVPQMWNSRQRWKDERKKVLKLSINKLTEIEDPELWLLRSVLINNTIKRLHQDIRTERQAKIRHRQQKMDFYNERYEPTTPTRPQLNYEQVDEITSTSSSTTPPSFDNYTPESPLPKVSNIRSCSPSDIYDDNSCDEIFSINEDFLRVTIPDRRVSSPIPSSPVQQEEDHHVATDNNASNGDNPTDSVSQMDVDQSSSESTTSTNSTSSSSVDCDETDSSITSNNNITITSPFNRTMTTHQAGSQCATQFRTNNTSGVNSLSVGDVGLFPPRVPILDSVVYHSLLASLESS